MHRLVFILLCSLSWFIYFQHYLVLLFHNSPLLPSPLYSYLSYIHIFCIFTYLHYYNWIYLLDTDPSRSQMCQFISCMTYCFHGVIIALDFLICLGLFIPIQSFHMCAARSVVSILLLMFFNITSDKYIHFHSCSPSQDHSPLFPAEIWLSALIWADYSEASTQFSCNFPLPFYRMYCIPGLPNPSNSISWFNNSIIKVVESLHIWKAQCF